MKGRIVICRACRTARRRGSEGEWAYELRYLQVGLAEAIKVAAVRGASLLDNHQMQILRAEVSVHIAAHTITLDAGAL